MLKRIAIGLVLALGLSVGGLALTAGPAAASLKHTASMSKSEYQKIKKGMTYAKVKRIVGGKGDCSTFDGTRRCEWRYRKNVGFALVDFDKRGKAEFKWYTVWH